MLISLDVIGIIDKVSPIKVVSVNGKDTQNVTVELRNEEYDILSRVSLLFRIDVFKIVDKCD